MTSALEITTKVVTALNKAGIVHMLVGAFSRNAYAHPRSTQDADLVVALGSGDLKKLVDMLAPEFVLESQATFESNTGTLRDTFVTQDSGFKIELFHLSSDEHDQERFKRRRQTIFNSQPTCIPTPEDVIITKLRWARNKDLEDIKDVLVFVEPANFDWNYLHHWTGIHGTKAKLEEIRSSIPKID